MNVPVTHCAHYLDGRPLCWSMDQEGEFVATEVEDEISCRPCLAYLKEMDDDDLL